MNRVSVVFFGFLNIFLFVRIFSPEEVGVWVLFLSLTSLFETIRNGFIRNPFISHYVSTVGQDRDKLLISSFVLHVGLAVVMVLFLLTLGGLLANFWNAPLLVDMFMWYALTAVVLTPFLQMEYIMQANLNFYGIFVSNFVRLVALTLFIGFYFFMGKKPALVDLVIVQLVATCGASLVSFYFTARIVWVLQSPTKDLVKQLFHFGKYTFGTTISSMLIKNTDSWMIGRMLSPVGVAMYTPALRISNIIDVPTLAVVSIVFPQINKKIEEQGKEGLQNIYLKSTSLIIAVMIPFILPIYFFSDWIIIKIFGAAYIEASLVLKVTIFYSLLVPFNRQFGTVMDAVKKPAINFYLLALLMVVNVGFNYFLISAYGVIGAAYGTLFSYIIIFCLNQIILFRKFGINIVHIPRMIWHWYKVGIGFLSSLFKIRK